MRAPRLCLLLSALPPILALGCAVGRGDPSLTSDDPALELPAMRQAVKTDSDKNIPQLIDDLDNADPAIRMFAIHTLEKMTGETRGYRFFDTEPVRAAAVRSWREAYHLPLYPPRSLSTHPTPAQPATAPAAMAHADRRPT